MGRQAALRCAAETTGWRPSGAASVPRRVRTESAMDLGQRICPAYCVCPPLRRTRIRQNCLTPQTLRPLQPNTPVGVRRRWAIPPGASTRFALRECGPAYLAPRATRRCSQTETLLAEYATNVAQRL